VRPPFGYLRLSRLAKCRKVRTKAAAYGHLQGVVNFHNKDFITSSLDFGCSDGIVRTLAALWPAAGHTEIVQAAGTESSAGGATDAWLVTRGLIDRGMVGEQSGPDIMTPASGVEVDETRQTENRTGQVLKQVKLWNETVGDDTIHIEVTTLSSYQFEVSFWLFPNHRQGCTMYQWTLYDHGRALQNTLA